MITFILGNGFDIQMGLLTRYTDFYKVYTKIKDEDSENVKKFKNDILKGTDESWKTWAEFESQMGEYTSKFDGDDPSNDFLECYEDFYVRFNAYLIKECERVDWNRDELSECLQVFRDSILFFHSYVNSVDRKFVSSMVDKDDAVNFLQFNYTNVFDDLLERSSLVHITEGKRTYYSAIIGYNQNLHLHGQFDGGHMTMGVDNLEQIANEEMRTDPMIQRIFVKPTFLDTIQERNVNEKIARALGVDTINRSTVICIFGSSIGSTDEYWWRTIGTWLRKSSGKVVIFDYCFDDGDEAEGHNPRVFIEFEEKKIKKKSEILKNFLKFSQLNEKWLSDNSERIIVELNSGTGIFNFKLPMLSD